MIGWILAYLAIGLATGVAVELVFGPAEDSEGILVAMAAWPIVALFTALWFLGQIPCWIAARLRK